MVVLNHPRVFQGLSGHQHKMFPLLLLPALTRHSPLAGLISVSSSAWEQWLCTDANVSAITDSQSPPLAVVHKLVRVCPAKLTL